MAAHAYINYHKSKGNMACKKCEGEEKSVEYDDEWLVNHRAGATFRPKVNA